MNKTTNYTPFSNLLGALGPPLFHVSKVIRIAPQWGNLDHFGSFLKKGALGALMNEKKNNNIDPKHGTRFIVFKKLIQST